MDPRIDWIGRYAPATLDREVIGFADASRPRPDSEVIDSAYSIERIGRSVPLVRSALHLMHSFFSLAPLGHRLAAASFLLVAALPAVTTLTVLALTLAGGRGLASLSRKSDLVEVVASPLRSMYRRMLRARVLQRLWVFLSMNAYYARTNSAIVSALCARSNFAVLHVNDLETLPAGVLLKWRTGVRLIYDSHEYWPYSDVKAFDIESWFWKCLERYLVRFVDAAFTVSDPLAAELTRIYGKTFVALPNCAPNTPFEHRTDARERRADDPVRFLYQGNFSPERGLEELLSAWVTITDPRALLILRGPDSPWKQACIQLAMRLGLQSPKVQFLEPVHESELIRAAVDFDVGVIPYKPDTLAYRFACPNKLSQYMQAGLAILANDLPYVSGLLDRFRCGLVYASHEPVTITRAVQQLTANRRSLEEMKRMARTAAATEFNWQRQSEPLYAAYLQAWHNGARMRKLGHV